jgi:hypothetical protein
MRLVGSRIDRLTWTLMIEASIGASAPEFQILGDSSPDQITLDAGDQLVEFTTPDNGTLDINYYSKKETDTVVLDGEIVRDTVWRIKKIWCDGILLESWFQNDCCYRPRYFQGYLAGNPNAPLHIHAPYQFNFPGTMSWQWQGPDFWQWYFHEKNRREVINFMDKDPDRVWKFRGSVEECTDLVRSIRALLKL